MAERHTNRLAGETSPYLLQHAHNPVEWYPWGEEALRRARDEDKPVLLSIGYAACHWCHVMERESFEDEATAAVMNEHFVAIKVDREERPDLDSIYMDAVQAMTGRGGWPLTAFLAPDGTPFYAGTYFPNEQRHGMPAFRDVLEAISAAWRDRREDVLKQGGRILRGIGRVAEISATQEPLREQLLSDALGTLRRAFDTRWGGFHGAPKFPQPMTLEFLLRCAVRGLPDARDMLTSTLDRMAAGGIHDQIGGGFHRYSVDDHWHVPHFEKMLYDNAQLARLYLRAWLVTGDEPYATVSRRTLDYLLREMRHAGGGFYSSQDADSEGVEGKFFVWSYAEIVESSDEAVAMDFGAVPQGNWEGTNVLWRPFSLSGVAAELELAPEELKKRVEAATTRLFELRERRVRPATDDKILASWNALAISAFAEAGRALDEPRFVEAAVGAAEFVLANLRTSDGRLARSWREGRAGTRAFADDHALLADALLTLYETTFDIRFFREARALCDELLARFLDRGRGGFFSTAEDDPALVLRPKDLFDNAVPSGNSVAAEVLLRMAALTAESKYEDAASSALRLVAGQAVEAATGFGQALSAVDRAVSPSREIAIVGRPGSEETRTLAREYWSRPLPSAVLAVAAEDDPSAGEEVALLFGRVAREGRSTAYVCDNFECKLPVTEPEELS
ncbi:MAG: thioredoxin domain-containing protein, partial [Actinomycetota bacterium]|nr:thioredoxin domain-containing protein [Actinomycetota bacterium]